jgi:Uma2 family endonuclease
VRRPGPRPRERVGEAVVELLERRPAASSATVRADDAILIAVAASPARRDVPASYDDLAALPPHVVGEILAGQLHVTPRPAAPHASAAFGVGLELGVPFQRGRGGPGGWLFLAEPELHLVDDIVVPDLAGWRRERLPAVPAAAFLTLPPDWVCEIASPPTQRLDRGVKMDIYLREQVKHLWLLDPLERFVEVFRFQDGAWVRVGSWTGDTPARIEPFDAVEIDLKAIWGEG